MPDPSDPDCGNLYRTLKFPDSVYKHIEGISRAEAAQLLI